MTDFASPQWSGLASLCEGGGARRNSSKILAPYLPELQPAERLWQLSDEAIVNR
ncbi:MAG: hypothetical protein KME12_20875 [Trichocoleus desertorum ATA4-8-CV12]|nr:hypothetical protein [Trichocoleus desertorum ATA4-8-CV12]